MGLASWAGAQSSPLFIILKARSTFNGGKGTNEQQASITLTLNRLNMERASYQRFPTVKIREMKDDYCKFELRDTDASIANALRRFMIAEVPTVAIELVEIETISSVLNDEFIAHRLGLILLKSERAMSMRFSRYCDACDGDGQCEFCSVEFHLRARCIDEQTLEVTSKDLYSSDHTVVPVHFSQASSGLESNEQRGIIIVKLRKGQELRLRAIARKGIG